MCFHDCRNFVAVQCLNWRIILEQHELFESNSPVDDYTYINSRRIWDCNHQIQNCIFMFFRDSIDLQLTTSNGKLMEEEQQTTTTFETSGSDSKNGMVNKY